MAKGRLASGALRAEVRLGRGARRDQRGEAAIFASVILLLLPWKAWR